MLPQKAVTSPSAATAAASANQSNVVRQLTKTLSENLNLNGEEFVKEEFDVKAFSSAIMKTNALSEHLASLAQCINVLDKEIREQVSVHHDDLLHQAINIETLEEMLDIIQNRIASLKTTCERLKTKISAPYNELNLRLLQLSRLQAACDTLRRIKGILFYSGKLRAHMQTGIKDIVKSAQALNELDFLLRNFDSSGIEIIEADVHFVNKARREVEEQAQLILEKGLVHQDQSQIGTALQVFYSLGVLHQKLVETLKQNEKNFQKIAAELLDSTNLTLQSTSSSSNLHTSASASFLSGSTGQTPQYPGRSTMPNVGSMGQFRAQLWSNVEKLMDHLYDSCAQIALLQQILEKKKDLLTNVLYLDEMDLSSVYTGKMYLISGASNPTVLSYDSICTIIDTNELVAKKTVEFTYEQWRVLMSSLAGSILTACNQSNYIKQTFQNEYPKLLKLVNDLWMRLLQLNPLIDRYRYPPGAGDKNQSTSKVNLNNPSSFASSYDMLRKCFNDLENSYLNRSLSHLFDPINLIFAQGTDKPINRADLDTYVKGIQTQLQTLQYDVFNSPATIKPTLTSCSSAFGDKVVGNICKSIQMYSNKSEQLLNTLNSELQQSISSLSSGGGGGGGSGSGSSHSAGISNMNIFFYSSGVPYQLQLKNLEFVNQTHEMYEQLTRLFGAERSLTPKLQDKLNGALKSLIVFEENSLTPYVRSASDCILAIMLTIHQEDFTNSLASSLYIRELHQVMQRIAQNYLQSYACKTIISACLHTLSVRCVDLFIRHASLLRPMSVSARNRLLADSQQIEQIVVNLLATKLTDLGVYYKQLKAFRSLLRTPSPFELPNGPSSLGEDVVDETHYGNVLDESLPYHVILHYLFSYAPAELKSPHQSLDWPVLKYSEWLDKHPQEKERLMVIKTSLEAYVNLVRQKKEKKFASIYPLMFRLLEKGLQSIQS